MGFTENQLSAYLDGELSEAETLEVEAALRTDAGLRADLARLHEVDAILEETLGGLADEAVPDQIVALVQGGPSVRDTLQTSRSTGWRGRLAGWTTPVGLAASLLLGVLIGGQLFSPISSGKSEPLLAGRVPQGSALYAALEHTQSGQRNAGFTPSLSFASERGVCREIQSSSRRALACRESGEWTVLVVTPDGGGGPVGGYRTASGETSILFDILADQLMTEPPMSVETEAARISNAWASPRPTEE